MVKPIVIAIWCGNGKPKSLNEFLSPLVNEINTIMHTGVDVNDHRIDIDEICFICDGPARSQIKGTKYFNGKHGCQKCHVLGVYFNDVRRMSFPQFDLPLRTDSSFRNRHDPEHHREKSPLENLVSVDDTPLLDMVRDFPTSDPLHLLEQGVMKLCIRIWMKGNTVYKTKWSDSDKNAINHLIYHCNKQLSSDIHRQIRSLQYLKFYKATEFRTILLYIGIVIFKNSLSVEIYEHFLRLSLAVRLSSCETYVKKNNLKQLARTLFSEYCVGFVTYYGSNSIVSNVHNISHISDDVNRFGSLTQISTYPFENCLREIKLYTKPSKAPLEQITRRIAEISLDVKSDAFTPLLEKGIKWFPELKYETKDSDIIKCKSIRIKPDVLLSTRKIGDSWFITRKNEIVQMKYATRNNDLFFIFGTEFEHKEDFFKKPYSSHFTDIYLCNTEPSEGQFYNITEIKAKLICVSYQNQFVAIPLLHSIDACSED